MAERHRRRPGARGRVVRGRRGPAGRRWQAPASADVARDAAVMELIATHARDGLLIQDVRGRIEWANPAYARITGYDLEELRGRSPWELVVAPELRPSAEAIAAFRYDLDALERSGKEVWKNVRKDGSSFLNELTFAVFRGATEAESRVIVMSRDVTAEQAALAALKEAKDEIERRADTDMLTGLANRAKLARVLGETLRAGAEAGTATGLFHVDLDFFKEVNDTIGHAGGDLLLVHAAAALRSVAGPGDLAARHGGDEFVLIRAGLSGEEELARLAGRLAEALARPLTIAGRTVRARSSIGAAASPAGDRDAEALLHRADVALYEAKRSGRGRFTLYTPALGRAQEERLGLVADLAEALASEAIGIVLQPQVCLARGAVTGFETLVRWQHPVRGLLSPAQFLPVAEETGRLREIDALAMSRGLDALARLRARGLPAPRVSLNVSARTLARPDYLDLLKWETERRDLAPSDVALEILESVLILDPRDPPAVTIRALKRAGYTVELDDFGTGHSGLAQLAMLDVDAVKIDRSFVRRIGEDGACEAIVRGIAALAREIGVGVIAEGVETRAQAAFLLGLGITTLQGYGLALPMSPEDLAAWLRTLDIAALPAAADPGRIAAA